MTFHVKIPASDVILSNLEVLSFRYFPVFVRLLNGKVTAYLRRSFAHFLSLSFLLNEFSALFV